MEDLVFIVDDSRTICKIVEVALGRAGIRCMSFPDGVVALKTLQEQSALRPIIILLDIQLPKLDGITLIPSFKKHHCCAESAMIMLTRREGMIDRLKAKLAGANDYVTKPFQVEELMSVLQPYLLAPSDEPFMMGKPVYVKASHPFAGLHGVLGAQINETTWEVNFPTLRATLPFPKQHLALLSKTPAA